MPHALNAWFQHHIYTTLLLATLAEGVGLPVPAELLFIGAAVMVHNGTASLGKVILVATLGNATGALLGFMLAYWGGPPLVRRVVRATGLKPGAMEEVAAFFARYGPVTIFLSRFIGFIRAATIYSAGAARVAPWRFAVYSLAAAFVWNAGWAYAAYRFGEGLHAAAGRGLGRALAVVALLLAAGLIFLWFRRRKAINSQ
ncbi:MAG TPA: DedA family protein [Symbiobacteriaceae bacterium]|nr:DedA family protein [Symbiobacteriaceae bacterium]